MNAAERADVGQAKGGWEVIDIDNAIEKIGNTLGFDAYHVTTFRCTRIKKSGGTQGVTIEILDGGPQINQGFRYTCIVRSHDGKEASGNPESSVDAALAGVHWEKLD